MKWRVMGLAVAALLLAACSGSSESAVGDDSSGQTSLVSTAAVSPPSATSKPTTTTTEPTVETSRSAVSTTQLEPPGCLVDGGFEYEDGFERADGSRCVDGEWTAPTVTTAAPTTISPESEQVVVNLLMVSDLANNDPAIAGFRDALVRIFEGDLGYDRVNVVSGEVTDDAPHIVIDATSGYSTAEYQFEVAADAIFSLATELWVDDLFGAQTPNGNGAVGLKLTSDGNVYNLAPDTMIAVAQRRVSAEQALLGQ